MTCEEQIKEMLESAMENVAQGNKSPADKKEYIEGILCVQAPAWDVDFIHPQAKRYAQVQLSWGGPADGFLVEFDEGAKIVQIRYYFQDWWDYAERVLSEGETKAVSKLLRTYVLKEMRSLQDFEIAC